MVPNEVFHYTKRDTAIEKIFFDKKIRLGQLGFTNDPRESKIRLFFNADQNKKPINDDWERLRSIIETGNNILTKEWKVFCVSQHHPDYTGVDQFRNGACRPRMWASYAENHRGLCLRFDGNKLNQRIEEELGGQSKIFHGPVVYDDNKAMVIKRIDYLQIEKAGIQEGMRNYLLENWEEEFLVKSEDWKTEYEYRWLIHNTKNEAEYVSLEGILTGIVIGMDFPRAYVPIIKGFCSELEIPVGRILWQNGNPLINYIGPAFLQ